MTAWGFRSQLKSREGLFEHDLRLRPVRVLAVAHLLPLSRSLAFFLRSLGQHFRVHFFLYKLLFQKPSRRWPFHHDAALQGSTLP